MLGRMGLQSQDQPLRLIQCCALMDSEDRLRPELWVTCGALWRSALRVSILSEQHTIQK